jgi:hypothetical protein
MWLPPGLPVVGNKPRGTPVMMRANFESSGYKPMKVKEFDRMSVQRFEAAREPSNRMARQSRAPKKLGIGTALLGGACVVAVFGVLAALYAMG